ncbi:hypothetical protein TKWG_09880 [Advenella kashmirensis WT001]|uniref:Uncharacterized protein n=1 Tax=Advenella kashmirensis (strain DSM 17095 / LMG 22695 / WT001) TaxID=1036672 RepID=I3UB78_ADVKW|nr:hypothetical protein TKWG_09880 [Advenella kashmirensis WT001]
MQYELNRHWQARLHVGQPGYITVCHYVVATLAMLCIAGPQAAVVFALLALAGRHHLASHRAGNIGMVQVGPDGYYRLFRKACSPQAGDIRILQQYWQGPWWFTLVLRDPYFPHSRPDIVTVWSSGQSPDAWRRFCALVQSAQWTNAQSAAARIAI